MVECRAQKKDGMLGFMVEAQTFSSRTARPCSTRTGARRTASFPAGVIFQADVYGGESDTEENWAEALGLAQGDIPVRLVPLGLQEDRNRRLPERTRTALDSLTRQRVDPARSVLYHSGAPTSWNLDFYGRCRIGRTAFGTDRIPEGWSSRCNAMDEVWVASEFNRETFADAGVDGGKLHVMRAGVDTQRFRPGVQPLTIPHTRGFTFLSESDLQPGAGTDILLRAYLQEFKADEDVALILKICEHAGSTVAGEAELAFFIEKDLGVRLEQTPPLILLSGALPLSESARIHAAAHAFVLPARGQAHGRAILEALASGLPVIATRWGGQLDFLNDANSFLIGIDGLMPASLESELCAGHFWAEPSVDHLRQLMREVSSHSSEALQRAQRGRRDAVDRWDWSVVIPEWLEAFRARLE
jgi:glycosyltransferase involved in cell wall biosynthesis